MSSNSQQDPLAGALFANLLLAIIIASQDQIEIANKEAQNLLGFSQDEFEQKSVHDLFSQSTREVADDLIESASRCVVRANVKTKAGEDIPVDINACRYKTDAGEKVVVLLQDARTSELVEELKREFITKVSSDLRSPLSAISGSLAILQSERMAKLSFSVKNVVTIAERNCKRLILMVNEILDLENLEKGRIRLQPRRADLSDIVLRAKEMVSGFVEEHAITIDCTTFTIPIKGDDERLTQVFANLLRNAIISSPKGGTVDVTCSNEHGGWAEVRVTFVFDSTKTPQGNTSDLLARRSLEVVKEIVRMHEGFFGNEDLDSNQQCYWVRIPASTEA